jgi:predicted O-linked N-acetylglucosamine transferase (SPINDLY family)
VLDAAPEHPLAHALLGSLLGASGRLDAALEHLQTAVRLDPSAAALRSDLGNVLRALDRMQEAEAAYRDAISIDPEFPGAHRNLGDLLRHLGRADDAIESLAKAASLTPDDADAQFMLADMLSQRGRYEEACRGYQAGLSIAPQVAAAHNNLGATLRHLSRRQEALASFESALRLDPEYTEAHVNLADMMESEGSLDKAIEHYRAAASQPAHRIRCQRNLGRLLLAEGRNDEALQCCREVLTLEPESASSHFELGNALMACGHIDEAMERFARATKLDPTDARGHVNLGFALRSGGRFEESARSFRQALKIDPELVEAHNNLGVVLQMQGELEPAMKAFERALMFAPSELYIQSNYLTCLNYQHEAVPEKVFEQHRRWAELVQGADWTKSAVDEGQLDSERRLRIGYVSADLRYHSVAFFITPIIERHDREKFEITCYANVATPDAETQRIRELSDHWRDITSMSNAEAADLIRFDGIDILVDLSGHTLGNRLPVFARKPAPVQVTYVGYPNTTGLDTVDYRLTDVMTDPPGWGEHLHSEELIRFDDGFLCFQPLQSCPDIREVAASDRSDGFVFGSFNELLKVTAPTVIAWCDILERVAGSQLTIKGTTLEDEGTRQRVRDRFSERGIDPARLRLIGRTATLEEHLELYNGIDVALDTFPYNGTTTTCEALWMGVPVVTQCGRSHASRVGLSLLTQVGLDDLVTDNAEDYVERAVGLADDHGRRRQLRGELRDRMRDSSLMDAERFTRKLEAAYRDMWRRACSARKGQSA